MSNSEVAALRPGDVVLDASGIPYVVRTMPRIAEGSTNYEAYAATASGSIVARVHHGGNFTRIRLEDIR